MNFKVYNPHVDQRVELPRGNTLQIVFADGTKWDIMDTTSSIAIFQELKKAPYSKYHASPNLLFVQDKNDSKYND